uniref:Uncharacterized protein n=1 Tax=Magallana gigas TaxID=29159 RepID=K1QC13_MAGGI
MLDVPIKVITIKGPNTAPRILTLCEVFVYASIKNKHGNFCPEKCQTNFNCKTDNLVCPTCQEGWGRPYCHLNERTILPSFNSIDIQLIN